MFEYRYTGRKHPAIPTPEVCAREDFPQILAGMRMDGSAGKGGVCEVSNLSRLGVSEVP